VPPQKTELLLSLLTEQRVEPPHKQVLNKTRWRYFGHACVLVETPSGVSILFDPIIAYHQEGDSNRFTLNDLPDHLDFVVLTHNHSDHVSIETLLALRPKVGTVVVPSSGSSLADPSLRLMLESIGFKNVVSLDSFQHVSKDDLTLTALPFLGEHGDLDIRTKAAWLVKSGAETLLFAADSNNLEPKLYDHIKEAYGTIATIFIGMECLGAPFSWTYGPYLPMAIDRKKDQSRRLNGSDFERGLKVIQSLGCESVYVYAMGAEPWVQFVTSIDPAEETIPVVNAKQLVDHCLSIGIKAERLFGSHDSYTD
jgi:L-ascorbate metabolism protein UlaG (beta-lactamase superfamily)